MLSADNLVAATVYRVLYRSRHKLQDCELVSRRCRSRVLSAFLGRTLEPWAILLFFPIRKDSRSWQDDQSRSSRARRSSSANY